MDPSSSFGRQEWSSFILAGTELDEDIHTSDISCEKKKQDTESKSL